MYCRFQVLQCSCAGCCSPDPPPPTATSCIRPAPPTAPAPPPIPEAWPVACAKRAASEPARRGSSLEVTAPRAFCGAEGACDGCCITTSRAAFAGGFGEEAPRPPGEYNMVAVITPLSATAAAGDMLLILLLRGSVRRARRGWAGAAGPTGSEPTIQLSPHCTHFSDDNLEALGATGAAAPAEFCREAGNPHPHPH